MRNSKKLLVSLLLFLFVYVFPYVSAFASNVLIDKIVADPSNNSIVISSNGVLTAKLYTYKTSANPKIIINFDNAELGQTLKKNLLLGNELVRKLGTNLVSAIFNEYGYDSKAVRLILEVNPAIVEEIKLTKAGSTSVAIYIPKSLGTQLVDNLKSAPSALPSHYPIQQKPVVKEDTSRYSIEITRLKGELDKAQETISDLQQSQKENIQNRQTAQDIEEYKRQIYDLKQELSIANSKLQDAASKLTSVGSSNSQIGQLNSKVKQLYDQLTLAKEQLENTQEQLRVVGNNKKSYDSLEVELSTTRQELSALKEQLNQKDLELEEYKQGFSVAQGQTSLINEARDHIGILEQELSVRKQEVDSLKAQLSSVTNKLSKIVTTTPEINTYKMQLEEKEKQLTQYELKIHDFDSKVTDYSRQLADKDDRLLAYDTKLKNLTDQLNQYQGTTAGITDLRSSVRDLESKLSQYAQQLSEKNNLVAQYEDKIKSLELYKEQYAEQFSEKNNLVAQYEDKIKSLELYKEQYAAQLGEKDSKIAHYQQKIQDIGVKVQDFKNKTVARENSVQAYETKMRQYQSDSEKYRKLNETLEIDLTTARTELADIKNRLDVKNQEIEDYQIAFDKTKGQLTLLNTAQGQIESLEKELNLSKGNMTTLKVQLEEVTKKLSQVTSEKTFETTAKLSALESKVQQLTLSNSTLAQEKDDLAQSVNLKNADLEQMKNLQKMVDSLTQENRDLKLSQDQLLKNQEKLEGYKQEITLLENTVRQISEASKGDNTALQKSQDRLNKALSIIKTLSARENDKDVLISSLQAELADLEQKQKGKNDYKKDIAILQDQVTSLMNQVETKDKEIVALKAQYNKIEEKRSQHELASSHNSKLDQKMIDKSKEIDRLKQQLNDLSSQLNLSAEHRDTTETLKKKISSLESEKQLLQAENLKLGSQVKQFASKNWVSQDKDTMIKNQQQLDDLKNKLMQTESTVVRLKNDKLAFESKEKELSELKDKIQVLTELSVASDTDDKVKLLRNQVDQLDSKLNATNKELLTQKQLYEQDVVSLKNELDKASLVLVTQAEELSKANVRLQDENLSVPVSHDNNQDSLALYNKAIELEKSGDKQGSVAILDKLIAINPEYVAPYILKGSIYTTLKDFKQAENSLLKALALDPDSSAAKNYLGNLYFIQGDYVHAMQYYQSAVSVNILNNLATSLEQQGKTQDAITFYNLLVQIKKDDPHLHYNLARAYGTVKDLDQAIVQYNRALSLNPKFSNAHYNLALAYAKIGKNQEAIKHFNDYVSLEPQSLDVEDVKVLISKLSNP